MTTCGVEKLCPGDRAAVTYSVPREYAGEVVRRGRGQRAGQSIIRWAGWTHPTTGSDVTWEPDEVALVGGPPTEGYTTAAYITAASPIAKRAAAAVALKLSEEVSNPFGPPFSPA